MPLMEKVDGELIIVDTGCDGETRAMMRVYTDQIIPFYGVMSSQGQKCGE